MYIGNDLQIAHPSYKIIDDISSGFNGSTTSFALQVSGATPVPFPISTQQVMISVNGVVQEPDPTGSAGFKLLGSNIVFSSAPANGHAFFGVINAGADYVTAGSEFPDGSATAPSFTFQDDQDTGWFRSGSGAVGYSANGAQTLTFDGNGLTVTGDASFVGDSSKNLLWDKSDGQLEFADSAKAIFGAGSDIQIYHDGTSNLIKAFNVPFRLQTNDSDNAIVINQNGSVELYYDNSKKVETSATGATVTGTLVAGGLTVDTNTLHIDATNNRVGIGTTVPKTLLHLLSDVAPTFSNDTHAGEALFVRSAGSDGDGNAQAVIGFGKSDGTASRSGAAIASVQTGSDPDSCGIGFYTTPGSSSVQTLAQKVLIDSSGKVGIGLTAPETQLEVLGSVWTKRSTADQWGEQFRGRKDRDGSIVQDNDDILTILGQGYDGSAYRDAAKIEIEIDGTPGSQDMPGRLIFSTTADGANSSSERMRIMSNGCVLINDTASNLDSDHTFLACGSKHAFQYDGDTGTYLGFILGSANGTVTLDANARSGNYPSLILKTGGQAALTIDNSRNSTFAGTVSDSKGDVRKIPANAKTSAYTLVASDMGKVIYISSGGVTIPQNVLPDGAAVTIVNNSGGDQTITQGSSVNLYNTADASTGNRTLAQRGMATVWFYDGSNAYISGAGLS